MILTSTPPWIWLASVLAVLAYALPALAPRLCSDLGARRLMGVAWLAHGASLLGLLAGPVRFGFAPAISVTAWPTPPPAQRHAGHSTARHAA